MRYIRIGRFLLDWTNFISLGYYVKDDPQWILYVQVGLVTKKTMVSDEHLSELMSVVGK